MIQSLKIIKARLLGYQNLQEITLNSEGIITQIQPWDSNGNINTDYRVIDVAGDWLSSLGIDLQINGGLGLAFTDLENTKSLPKICQFLWEKGIGCFLPTIVTTSVFKIQRSLAVIAEYISSQPNQTAQILGVHLEGPFLNSSKRGAHPAEHLLPLNIENLKRVMGEYGKIIKIITLAPELDTTGQVIPYLRSLGIIVSLGHSLATADQAKKAFEQGASMVTHSFNAMPSLHHREPGLLGEAMINPHVYCGLIADGHHVCPTMIKLLLRTSEKVFLVSDALAPIGLEDGIYPWDNREIIVKQGTARLADGTLAGTTLPLLVGVENLVKWGICTIPEAIALATEAPRQAISLPSIEIGQPGRFLHWKATTGELVNIGLKS